MADASATIEAPEQDALPAASDDGGAPATMEMSAEQPAAPEIPQAEPEQKKQKKGSKGKLRPAAQVAVDGPSIAGHPRAVRSVARAKGWGGLLGFLLGGYLSLPTHTLADAGLRALIAGVACYVAVWAGALFVWRRLVMLEIKAREQQLLGEVLAAAGIGPPGKPGSPEGTTAVAVGGKAAS